MLHQRNENKKMMPFPQNKYEALPLVTTDTVKS